MIPDPFSLYSGSGSCYFATDGLFITVGHLRPSCCGAPSLTRGRVCNLIVQFTVTLLSKSRRTHDHILLYHLRLHQPGASCPCIYIPQEQGGPIIPQALGFPFVASHSQGYGGGILAQVKRQCRCTTIILDIGFLCILYTTTLIRVITLYEPSQVDCSWVISLL
jgi:hypothetical protein